MVYLERCGMMEMLIRRNRTDTVVSKRSILAVNFRFDNVKTTMSRLGRSSFDMDYRIISESKGEIVARERLSG